MGSPVVTTQCFDCHGPGSVIGGDTKILQNHIVWPKMKYRKALLPSKHTCVHYPGQEIGHSQSPGSAGLLSTHGHPHACPTPFPHPTL